MEGYTTVWREQHEVVRNGCVGNNAIGRIAVRLFRQRTQSTLPLPPSKEADIGQEEVLPPSRNTDSTFTGMVSGSLTALIHAAVSSRTFIVGRSNPSRIKPNPAVGASTESRLLRYRGTFRFLPEARQRNKAFPDASPRPDDHHAPCADNGFRA